MAHELKRRDMMLGAAINPDQRPNKNLFFEFAAQRKISRLVQSE
jgi:hypothetical protein